MFWFLLCAFGVVAGVTTVLFGFGGGFVAVPLLFTLISVSHAPGSAIGEAAMHIAVATSTAAMIFGAGLSTLRHARARTLQWPVVRPLLGYVALGAVLGAWAATQVQGAWIRWLFIGYLGLTILDAVLRPGFTVSTGDGMRPLGRRASAVIGVGMGAVAAFLGVGGSVMSVPLMRRRGASMAVATASANPLSLPMAIAGTAAYAVLAWRTEALGPWFAGYIDVRALAVLVLGSWCGIRLAAPWIGRMPDALHVKCYLALLGVVLVVMVVA